MKPSHIVFAAVVLALPTCGESKECSGPTCFLEARGADAGSLSDCIPGAWRAYGDGGSCAPIPCRADGGGPQECAWADCVQQVYTVFMPAAGSGGTMFLGSYVASATAGTWSSTIAAERVTYTVEGSRLVTDNGGGPRSQEVTCTAEQLVLGQIALKSRASAVESVALRALMIDGGTWSGLPYP